MRADIDVLQCVLPAIVTVQSQSSDAVNGYGWRVVHCASVDILTSVCQICGANDVTHSGGACHGGHRHLFRRSPLRVAESTGDSAGSAMDGLAAPVAEFLARAAAADTSIAKRITAARQVSA